MAIVRIVEEKEEDLIELRIVEEIVLDGSISI